MKTVSDQGTRVPPRLLVRTFWMIHKAIVRYSRGRIGLWRPREGKRFGVMGLITVGRRSGTERTVIVGYFEDGANLVTLAMNGWADRPPAWWMNLEVDPEASVLLTGGARRVRARRATDSERDRLWARFEAFPGWGDDLDALASKRSTDTPIVVFEPRDSGDDDLHAERSEVGVTGVGNDT